jgi:hypothetical protein
MMMRLFGAVAPAAAAMLAAVCPAEAQPGAGDSVTGSGSGDFVMHFQIDARSGPSGENPSGHVTVTDQRLNTLDGPVTCLAVDGNVATVNVQREDGGISTQMWFDGAAGPSNADGIIFGFASRTPDDCSPLTPAERGLSALVSSGGITIHDAQPLPTTKDQCKNGGWKSYGVFKNQGDCVSFVATKGKNPPRHR